MSGRLSARVPGTGQRRYLHPMRREVEALIRLGPLPADDALDEETASRFVDALNGLPASPTGEEAEALVAILPPDDSAAVGLAWTLLHAVEASPEWPVWSALDDRNWWVTRLRQRCELGGLARPAEERPIMPRCARPSDAGHGPS